MIDQGTRPPQDLDPVISIISPAYNEQDNLRDLYDEIRDAIADDVTWELILVDDGSTDNTAGVLRDLCQRDGRVSAIRLSRHYGHQIALTAGYDLARGQAVISMDSDLEHPPSVVPALLAQWRAGNDIVLARRRREPSSLPHRLLYRLFMVFMRRVADVDLVPNTADFTLMDRKVVDYFNQYRESSRFIRGIVSDLGYRRAIVDYDEPQRRAGRSYWNWWRLMKFGLSGVMSFSAFPLRISFVTGLAVSLLSITYAVWIVIAKLLYGAPAGIPSILVGVFFLGGVQLISIGVLGEYVANVFTEVKRRPLYCIAEVVGRDQAHR
jgi:glycosyltransferase involved in cell wall biosynthesis